jgi:ribonuclease PH
LFLFASLRMHGFLAGSLAILPRAGSMQNIRSSLAQPIPASAVSAEVQKDGPSKSRGSSPVHYLEALGPVSLNVDCDILNADGGTRCASITAAGIALRLAVRRLIASGTCLPLEQRPTFEQSRAGFIPAALTGDAATAHENAVMEHDIAAISVGLIDGATWLDLDYILDSNADVDMNVIMTSDVRFVEIQGTGEEATYSRAENDALLNLAEKGLAELHALQVSLLSDVN